MKISKEFIYKTPEISLQFKFLWNISKRIHIQNPGNFFTISLYMNISKEFIYKTPEFFVRKDDEEQNFTKLFCE
jgi:hypothetical protein